MTPIETAKAIRSIGNQARSAFTQRDEAVTTIELALVSGTHAILLGPPGTGKSTLIRFFAKALQLSFFRKLLNPDIKREDLVGPVKPSSIAQDKWDRAWLGLATSNIVFLDEIGKASGQVRNMLLDAMEERLVSSGDNEKAIPLMSMFSASNETLDADSEAIWDRFSLRCVVGYIQSSGDFFRYLTSDSEEPKPNPITEDDMNEMRRAVKLMAKNASKPVRDTVVELWVGYKTVSNNRVSDRRWKMLLHVAAANALLNGRTSIEPQDLIAGKQMLWQSVREIDQIQEYITNTVNKDEVEFKASEALVSEIEILGGQAKTTEEKGRVTFRCEKLARVLVSKGDRCQPLIDRLTIIKERMMED